MEQLTNSILERLIHVENNLKNYTEAELTFKQNPEKWSKKEVLGHLIDSAQNNIRRMVVGQYKEKEHIIYEQNNWIKAADYQHYNTTELINLFVLLNKHFCILLNNLPLENYSTLCNWGKEADNFVTLEYVAHDYLVHMDHHINQMFFENYTKKFGEK